TRRGAAFDRHALARDVAHFMEALPEGRELPIIGVNAAEQADDRHCGLLHTRREWPHGSAAEQRDELATVHSITSPARATSAATVRRLAREPPSRISSAT